jgi:hypothetical protein
VPLNGALTLTYDPSFTNLTFLWSITLIGPVPSAAGAPGIGVIGRASSASFSSQSPKVTLSSYGLTPGTYRITVQAQDSSGQTSAPASATVVLTPADLSSARIHPNPWRSDIHGGQKVTFDQLTGNVTIKIFTTSGHLVTTLTSAGAPITWDLTNDSGDHVASGVYHVLVTNDMGQKTHTQLGIIR